jgi:hypothetical protein
VCETGGHGRECGPRRAAPRVEVFRLQ